MGKHTEAIITALATAVLMFVAGYFTVGNKLVSAQEVREIVKESAPYATDKKAIEQKFEAVEKSLDKVEERVNEIDKTVQANAIRLEILLRNAGELSPEPLRGD